MWLTGVLCGCPDVKIEAELGGYSVASCGFAEERHCPTPLLPPCLKFSGGGLPTWMPTDYTAQYNLPSYALSFLRCVVQS